LNRSSADTCPEILTLAPAEKVIESKIRFIYDSSSSCRLIHNSRILSESLAVHKYIQDGQFNGISFGHR
jgi:hypothetical protein